MEALERIIDAVERSQARLTPMMVLAIIKKGIQDGILDKEVLIPVLLCLADKVLSPIEKADIMEGVELDYEQDDTKPKN